MLKRGFRIALVAVASVLTIPSLLVASDRSAAVANAPPVISGERRSLEGLRREAAALLGEGRYAAAATAAQQVVVRQPLDRTALQLLSRAEEGMGHQDRADDLAIATSFVSWRDPYAEIQIFLLSLAAGRLDDAAQRADAISRVHGARRMGFRALNTLVAQPGGAAAVATRLATLPPWRDDYFRSVGIGAAPQQIPTLLRAMSRTATPASQSEEGQALAIMVARGEAPAAWTYWRSTHRVGKTALIDDPDFQAARVGQPGQANSPFVWSMPADTLVRVIGHRDAASQPGLLIEAGDDRSPMFVSRQVLIAPGRYRLSYRAKGENGQLERLYPEIHCSSGSQPKLEPSAPEGGMAAFTGDIPPGCGVARLGFTLGLNQSPTSTAIAISRVDLRPMS